MSSGKVLVTGASGYVAAHVVDQLLKKGYHVRGTVRSQKKADELHAIFSQYKGKLEFVIVPDIAKDNAYAGVLDGITGIFHTASPFHFKVTNNKTDLLDPAIKGTEQILKEAIKYPAIKKVIITSSIAAVLDFAKVAQGHAFTEEDWNPATYEQALVETNPMFAYFFSKKLSEKAAWDFVKEHKPHFQIATICPDFVFGPYTHHVDKLSELNESARTMYEFASGKKVEPPVIDTFCDVRDVAQAHILAYEKSEANGQRYIVHTGNYFWQEFVDYIHKNFPNQTKADVGTPGSTFAPVIKTLNDKSKKLGVTYHTKEQTYHDVVAQFIKVEKK